MSLSLFGKLIPKRRPSSSPGGLPLEKARLAKLKELTRKLGVSPGDGRLLNAALTHKSYAHEGSGHPGQDNEKLEFLGDSVLGLVICQHVFQTYPGATEGGLSKVKSVIVSAEVLSEKAKALGLGDYLLLGRGEEKSGGKNRPALLADSLEAVIGAVYLTGGLKAAEKVVLGLLREDVDNVFTGRMEKDYKTLLQEHFQKTRKLAPRYVILREWGPDHNRNFETACVVDGKTIATGEGKSKKESEQAAAREAIRKFQISTTAPSGRKVE